MGGEAKAISTPYCGAAPSPAEFLTQWNFDPVLLTALGAMLALGWRISPHRPAFLVGWAVLVLAFVSPLCAMTTALFTARALHHLLLTSLAAPLLALALPRLPVAAWPALMATAFALVLWHVPLVYSAAWQSATVYWLLQAALLLPAWAFWGALLQHDQGRSEDLLTRGLMIGALAAVMGMIGAVLTFAPRLLYPEHLLSPFLWGLDPLADQQLAGLIMWVPGLLPLGIAAALMARRAWAEAAVA